LIKSLARFDGLVVMKIFWFSTEFGLKVKVEKNFEEKARNCQEESFEMNDSLFFTKVSEGMTAFLS
jgi:hypothetical protein